MIILRAEFTTRTGLGLSKCSTEYNVYGNYRDVENVEQAVAWIKSLFHSKKYSNPMIDFCYFDEHEITISRYFRFYSDGITYIYFGGKGEAINKLENVKFGASEIKKAYLACADKAIEWEEEKQQRAEA